MGKTDLTPHVERGETQQLEVVVPDEVEDGDAELLEECLDIRPILPSLAFVFIALPCYVTESAGKAASAAAPPSQEGTPLGPRRRP